MSDQKCQFSATDEPCCELSSLPGKPFCSKHLVKVGSIEEMEQVNKTGLSTKKLLGRKNPLAPEIDPEVAALRDFEAAGAPEVAYRPEAPKPPSRLPEDPEIYASKLADLLVAQEQEERLARFGGSDGRRSSPEGSTKKVPFRFAPRRVRPDSTMIVDPETGENPVPKGWTPRWVREVDHNERPTAQRVVEFEDYGYVPVKDRNGKTIKSNLGVAMMAPAQQYALRVKEKAPLGGITRETLLEGAEQALDAANTQIGHEAARVYVGSEHGAVRAMHDPSAKR